MQCMAFLFSDPETGALQFTRKIKRRGSFCDILYFCGVNVRCVQLKPGIIRAENKDAVFSKNTQTIIN